MNQKRNTISSTYAAGVNTNDTNTSRGKKNSANFSRSNRYKRQRNNKTNYSSMSNSNQEVEKATQRYEQDEMIKDITLDNTLTNSELLVNQIEISDPLNKHRLDSLNENVNNYSLENDPERDVSVIKSQKPRDTKIFFNNQSRLHKPHPQHSDYPNLMYDPNSTPMYLMNHPLSQFMLINPDTHQMFPIQDNCAPFQHAQFQPVNEYIQVIPVISGDVLNPMFAEQALWLAQGNNVSYNPTAKSETKNEVNHQSNNEGYNGDSTFPQYMSPCYLGDSSPSHNSYPVPYPVPKTNSFVKNHPNVPRCDSFCDLPNLNENNVSTNKKTTRIKKQMVNQKTSVGDGNSANIKNRNFSKDMRQNSKPPSPTVSECEHTVELTENDMSSSTTQSPHDKDKFEFVVLRDTERISSQIHNINDKLESADPLQVKSVNYNADSGLDITPPSYKSNNFNPNASKPNANSLNSSKSSIYPSSVDSRNASPWSSNASTTDSVNCPLSAIGNGNSRRNSTNYQPLRTRVFYNSARKRNNPPAANQRNSLQNYPHMERLSINTQSNNNRHTQYRNSFESHQNKPRDWNEYDRF